jgi:lambda repressor-like predicted transcriptional regulator
MFTIMHVITILLYMNYTIKEEIRAILRQQNTNVLSLEKSMGVTPHTIQKMLDRGSIRYDMCKKIADHLGLTIKWE